MHRVVELLNRLIDEELLIQAVISNYTGREDVAYKKIDIRPVELKGGLHYQFSFQEEKKVFHENLKDRQVTMRILTLMGDGFRQVMIFASDYDYQVLVSKKGKINIIRHKASRKKDIDLSHNRQKDYILKENTAYDFLVRLKVMNKEGRVLKPMYDKFRQINRFLELVEDIVDELDPSRTLNIVDFGCGKSYLTFALYHYLVYIRKLDVRIVGLDLKEDVIDFCNEISRDLAYESLEFIHGDIVDYRGREDVDMVVTLHACNNATDAALVKAIGWNAKVILSVPCCQHEFRDKLDNPVLEPMLKHGIIRDKLSSLVTDSLRGQVLELLGYRVQLLEFIDMEHTPKNILIRAVRGENKISMKGYSDYEEFKKFFNLRDLFIEDELKKIDIEL